MDRERGCKNPRLKRMVFPRPNDAVITPDRTPCTRIEAPFTACRFGAPPEGADRTVVLLGDSHADHWRAAVDVVARALRWSVISVTHGSCPYTKAVQDRDQGRRDACVAWNQAVSDWFRDRPEISAVITSNRPGPVYRKPGQTMMEAWVEGTLDAWDELPATVTDILVIRDVPFSDPIRTLPCVERARKRRRDAGRACARLRRRAVHNDPQEVAARRVPDRARVVDLTDFFCGPRLCYPVVGGALVYKDVQDHLTAVFSKSLGRYLLRHVVRALSA